MVEVRVEVPAWIFSEIDDDQFIYEISRMIRETIAILTEKPRTNPERIIKRAITRLVIARTAVETFIAIRRTKKSLALEEVEKALNEALKRVEERISMR